MSSRIRYDAEAVYAAFDAAFNSPHPTMSTPAATHDEIDLAAVHLGGLSDLCHDESVRAGWHEKPREDGTMIALIHSEISEAMEGLRKDLMDDHLPSRPMAEVELADALIRIFDFAGMKGYDLGGAFAEKIRYNRTRADHSREARAAAGGKQF